MINPFVGNGQGRFWTGGLGRVGGEERTRDDGHQSIRLRTCWWTGQGLGGGWRQGRAG